MFRGWSSAVFIFISLEELSAQCLYLSDSKKLVNVVEFQITGKNLSPHQTAIDAISENLEAKDIAISKAKD